MNHPDLTCRQLDAIRLVADGKTNKEIARELNIDPLAVKVRLQNIALKLGTGSRACMVGAVYRYMTKELTP